MKYYAVTDDPNELMHFGIKGMKWGVRRTDAQLGHPRHTGSGRQRSAAYQKASNKLSRMMKNGIKKAEANWQTYNSPQNKAARAAKRYEKQTNHAIQLARKGKLKYGKLTDDQVRRVTDRLNLERQARQLSDTEKTFGKKLRESISSGVISGVGQGVAGRVSERIKRGSVLKTERMKLEQNEEFEKRKDNRRIKNAEKERLKKYKEELERDKQKDAYEHERDKSYEQERVKNIAEYGAVYDKDGKLDYSNPNMRDYYNQRYVAGITNTQRLRAQASSERDQQRFDTKEAERQQRLEDQNRRDQLRAQVRLAEAAEAQQDAARRQAEIARQREGKRQLLKEANEREARQKQIENQQKAEQAWKDREERIRNRQAISNWASEIGSGTANPYGYAATRTYNRRRRQRKGRR